MNENSNDLLHAPPGINFDCTACGACCQKWPIVVHDQDIARITALLPETPPEQIFQVLAPDQRQGLVYSHITRKRQDGRCVFLDASELCDLHAQFGADAKPIMCRIFPYSFIPTPSGIYVSLSFSSTGVRLNSGKPLTDQIPLLQERWQMQKKLMNISELVWQDPEMFLDQPINWSDYLAFEQTLLQIFSPADSANLPLLGLCADACSFVEQCQTVAPAFDQNIGIAEEFVDLILLEALLQYYFQPAAKGADDDLNSTWIIEQLKSSAVTERDFDDDNFLLSENNLKRCREFQLGNLDRNSEDLLKRFIYCRVFGKTYFGIGHSNLSVSTGFYNLIATVVIFRIYLKLVTIEKPDSVNDIFCMTSSFLESIERNRPSMQFSSRSATVLEYFFSDQNRIKRFLALAI